MEVVGPAAETYETELGLAASADHMTTFIQMVNQHATFWTTPNARTAGDAVDRLSCGSRKDLESWVSSVASDVPATSDSLTDPLSLAEPAEVIRFIEITAAGGAPQSYIATVDWNAPCITPWALLVAAY